MKRFDWIQVLGLVVFALASAAYALPIGWMAYHSSSQELARNTDYRGPPVPKEKTELPEQTEGKTGSDDKAPSITLSRDSLPTSPLYVHTTCDEEDRSAECQKGWWKKLWTDPVATFTGALFIATCGLWWFTGKLWRTTARAVNEGDKAIAAANRSATEAARAATAMEKEGRRRIYLMGYIFYRDAVQSEEVRMSRETPTERSGGGILHFCRELRPMPPRFVRVNNPDYDSEDQPSTT